MSNKDEIDKAVKNLNKIKEIFHKAGKDAVLRSGKKCETALGRSIMSEFPKIPKKSIESSRNIRKVISKERNEYGIVIYMKRIPIMVWEVLNASVKNHLINTIGARFREKVSKKGKLSIRRIGSKNDNKRISSRIGIHIKHKSKLYRTRVFPINAKGRYNLFKRKGRKITPLMTSSSSEIMTNRPTRKLFLNDITTFFVNRLKSQLDYRLKGIFK